MDSQRASNSPTILENQWDAELYDTKHSFVTQLATDLVDFLSPKRGESILDLGCGTGHLTDKIAAFGADVMGIDSAPSMIEQARRHYPNLHFQVVDATNLQFTECFDAVFSNAVLHWIKDPEKVVAGVSRSLKPGGRFVAEFGGKGNIKAITKAIYTAMQTAGYPLTEALNPWYFPSIGEYSALLEQHGLQVTFATLFERPTPLNDGDRGMQNWIKMFANHLFQILPNDKQANVLADIENQLRSQLYIDGTWFADYRRIRVIAQKEQI